MLHYYITDYKGKEQEERTEPMLNMYEGIFSKEFTMFYGERLTYYIVEECGSQTRQSKVAVLEYNRRKKNGNSRCV